jgi:hypothetical protein
MIDQRPVNCYQTQSIAPALREQHPVERVAGCRFRQDPEDGVEWRDREKDHADLLDIGDKVFDWHGGLQLSHADLDRNLPKRCCANEDLFVVFVNETRNVSTKLRDPTFGPRDQDEGVD